jgi:hypothetical protein
VPPWERPGPPPEPEHDPGDRGAFLIAIAALALAGIVAFAAMFLRFVDASDATLWQTWKVADICQAGSAALCVFAAFLALEVRGRAMPLVLAGAGGLLGGIANWWSFPGLAGGAVVSGVAGIAAFFAGAAAASVSPGVRGRDADSTLTAWRLIGAVVAGVGTAAMATGLAQHPSTWGSGRVLLSNLGVVLPCFLFAMALALVRTRALAYLLLAAGAAATGYFGVSLLEIWAQPGTDPRGKDFLMAIGALAALAGGIVAAVGWPRPWPAPDDDTSTA